MNGPSKLDAIEAWQAGLMGVALEVLRREPTRYRDAAELQEALIKIVERAGQNGYATSYARPAGLADQNEVEGAVAAVVSAALKTVRASEEICAPEFSETALALELAEKHGIDWRFVADTVQWLLWNGSTWSEDHDALTLSDRASIICCNAAQSLDPIKQARLARSLASRRTQQAVVNLLKTRPEMVVTHEQLDRDPLLLGTADGVVDFRTGELRPAQRDDLITMAASVAPAPPGTPHPIWDEFLRTTFPLVPGQPEPDEELIAFLQRWAGFSITALTTKHHFAFFLGRGRNGKGVLFETLRRTLGDYAFILASETLMERNLEPHRAELAGLRGKRLILSSEVSIGKQWNEARLNSLSAGDPITANFMRGNPFTFKPVGKLWIAANHMPGFRVIDTHTTERLMLIWMRVRFLERVPEEEPGVAQQDQGLTDSLAAEHPAILRWLIDGARIAVKDGLGIPDGVRLASQSYLETEDTLGGFIAENCISISGGAPLSELFEVWNARRREERERPFTLHEFRKLVETRHRIERASYGMKVIGLALNDVGRATLLRERERLEETAPAKKTNEGERI